MAGGEQTGFAGAKGHESFGSPDIRFGLANGPCEIPHAHESVEIAKLKSAVYALTKENGELKEKLKSVESNPDISQYKLDNLWGIAQFVLRNLGPEARKLVDEAVAKAIRCTTTEALMMRYCSALMFALHIVDQDVGLKNRLLVNPNLPEHPMVKDSLRRSIRDAEGLLTDFDEERKTFMDHVNYPPLKGAGLK